MIVQCDNCKAKFNLADEKITDKGLKVRCSKCKTVFVAKRPAAESAPAAPPPPPPPTPTPAASAPSPAAKPAAGESADPFTDFSFSDDLDLSSKEETATKAPASTERAPATPSHQDYTPTAVPAPAKPAAASPPEDEDQFNFADADFAPPASPPPPPPKPAAPKPAPPKPAPPKAAPAPSPSAKAKAKPAGSSDDVEFGDFNFDEESFAEPEAPPAKASAPAGEARSAGSRSGEKPKAAAGKAAPQAAAGDEESFGDFHFDTDGNIGEAGAEPSAADDLGDFVRSPTSKAPVQDDLEASLESDSEPESTPAPRLAAAAAPTVLPGKPVIRHAGVKRNSTPWILLGVLAFFLVGLGGGIGYLHVSGRFTVKDLLSGNFTKIKEIPAVKQFFIRMGWMEAPDTGIVEVLPRTREDAFILSREGMDLLVVKGSVKNGRRKPQSFLEVEVTLKDKAGNFLAAKSAYCDDLFTKDELQTLSREDIESFMNGKTGRNVANQNVKYNESRDFMVVFWPMPAGVASAEVKVSGYMDADEGADQGGKPGEGAKSPEPPQPSPGATPP